MAKKPKDAGYGADLFNHELVRDELVKIIPHSGVDDTIKIMGQMVTEIGLQMGHVSEQYRNTGTHNRNYQEYPPVPPQQRLNPCINVPVPTRSSIMNDITDLAREFNELLECLRYIAKDKGIVFLPTEGQVGRPIGILLNKKDAEGAKALLSPVASFITKTHRVTYPDVFSEAYPEKEWLYFEWSFSELHGPSPKIKTVLTAVVAELKTIIGSIVTESHSHQPYNRWLDELLSFDRSSIKVRPGFDAGHGYHVLVNAEEKEPFNEFVFYSDKTKLDELTEEGLNKARQILIDRLF